VIRLTANVFTIFMLLWDAFSIHMDLTICRWHASIGNQRMDMCYGRFRDRR